MGLRLCYLNSVENTVSIELRAYIDKAKQLAGLGHVEQALQILRALRPHLPGDLELQAELRTLLARTKKPATLLDIGVEALPQDANISGFVACLPKSGSTFATLTMAELLGVPHCYAFSSGYQSEQEIYVPRLLEAAVKNGVVQQHVRATEENIQYLQAFGVRPIVLVRDIFDALASLRDMACRAHENHFFADTFASMSVERQFDTIVYRWSFWYMEFFASWQRAYRANRLPILFVRYEDMIREPAKVFQGMLQHSRTGQFNEFKQERILEVIEQLRSDPKKIRLRKGAPGTGQKLVSKTARRYVDRCRAFFTDIDFSMLGLLQTSKVGLMLTDKPTEIGVST